MPDAASSVGNDQKKKRLKKQSETFSTRTEKQGGHGVAKGNNNFPGEVGHCRSLGEKKKAQYQ